EVLKQAREDAGGAEGLGLGVTADSDRLEHVRAGLDGTDDMLEDRRGADLDVVDAGLQAVGWVERLAHDEVAGGEMQADAVLERREGADVEVDPDVDGTPELTRGGAVEAGGDPQAGDDM